MLLHDLLLKFIVILTLYNYRCFNAKRQFIVTFRMTYADRQTKQFSRLKNTGSVTNTYALWRERQIAEHGIKIQIEMYAQG